MRLKKSDLNHLGLKKQENHDTSFLSERDLFNTTLLSAIFIPGNVPSSKNSRINFTAKDKFGQEIVKYNGKKLTLSLPAKNVQNYKKTAGSHFLTNKTKFLQLIKGKGFPLFIGFRFIWKDHRRRDFANSVQIVQDMMVKYGWIPDDSEDYILPVPLISNFSTINPGVLIYVF